MASEEDTALVSRWLGEVWSGGNLDAIRDLVARDYVLHDFGSGATWSGPDGVRQMIAGIRAAIPDLQVTLQDIIGEEDKVALRWMGRGTHRGEMFGVSATGKPIEVTGTDIYRIRGGRIAEAWSNWDFHGMLSQIGAVTSPGH